MGKVRRDAVRLVKYRRWSTRRVALYTGHNQSTIVRLYKKDPTGGWHEIPTLSSKPKHSPKALSRSVVKEIVKERVSRIRCAEHVHCALKNCCVEVSLSSVKRTPDRCNLTKRHSPWKRPTTTLKDLNQRTMELFCNAILYISLLLMDHVSMWIH